MKSQLSWQEYQDLEFASGQPQKRPSKQSLGSKLNNVWQSVLAYLATSSEPRIWKTQDAAGQIHWQAYDPVTRQSADFTSEIDMLVWLEERHYQYHHSAFN